MIMMMMMIIIILIIIIIIIINLQSVICSLQMSYTAHAVVYKTSVSHFRVKNKPLKDVDGKVRFQRMLNFHSVDKGKLFLLVVRGIRN